MAEQEGKTIHSVAKAIRLLDILTESGQPASLTELYQKTGWPKSTIHGLLSTMRESGLIEQTPNGRYWLGIRLFEYGCAVSNSWDIGTIARPHMQSICVELGESVFLSVFDRAAVVTLAEEESRASLRVVSEVGARLPVYCTSQGKLFLASVSQAECRRILRQAELKAYTPNTLTQPEQFTAELQRIREQGYAVVNIDATLIAQAPKVAPDRETMRQNIAAALEVDVSQISVKATTEEHLGFTGTGEGMAAHAVALVEKVC